MTNGLFAVVAASWLGFAYANTPTTPPKRDYIGVVAATVAYASLLPRTAPIVPPKPVDPKNCPTCKNSGRPGWVRTGDDQHWTRCQTCQPISELPTPPAAPIKVAPPKPAPAGWPPRPVGQPLGNCPTCVYQSFSHS